MTKEEKASLERRIEALENPTSLTKAVTNKVKDSLDKPPTQLSNATATAAAIGTILFFN